MQDKVLRAVIRELTEVMGDGVHIVDEDGVSFVYNSAMEIIEDTQREDVLARPFSEAFPNIPLEESTLRKALGDNQRMVKFRQTYKNKVGKEITTINTTVPVTVEGKVVAAIELSKDVTNIKAMADYIIEYRNNPPKIRQYTFADLVGKNEGFQKVIEQAKKASAVKASVFIYGETGTGKELLAQSIHFDGVRKGEPFIAQNCAAVPEALFEGILFGTEKGSFTGAIDRPGLFEQASGGTLLLDEVSAMPYDLQSKLLRVLQEDYIRRVGGTKDIPVDVRIIATVNEKPEKLITQGALRKDLYYRLNIVGLKIPALNQRRDDIPLLAEKLLEKHNKKIGKRVEGFSDEAMEKLERNDYKGNVRELENIIMSAVALSDQEKILTKDHITLAEGRPEEKALHGFEQGEESLDKYMGKVERQIILDIMQECNNNVSQAAQKLGIKRQTLQHKLKKEK